MKHLEVGADGNARPVTTPHDVLAAVAREFRVAARRIKSRTRAVEVVIARDELCRRLRELGWSTYAIGRFLGGRDNSAVFRGANRAEARLINARLSF